MKVIFAIVCLLMSAAAVPVARAQDDVDRLDMRGHAAFDRQDYAQAIKCWGAAVKLDPSDATAWFNLATAYELNKEWGKAMEGYGEAIRLYPTDPDAYQYRAEVYRAQMGEAGAKGGTDEADKAKAIADLGEMVRLRPNTASYIIRGGSYQEMGDFQKAIADYESVIKLDPNGAQGYQLRGQVYSVTGEWDKAIADYTQVLAMEPNSQFDYCLRGEAYYQKKDWEKAIADANEAIKIDPDNADALSLRGNAMASEGKYDKAFEDINHLMTTYPDNPEGFNAAAWLYATCPKAELRNGAKAVELAEKACGMVQWKNASFIDTMAAACAEAGQWDDAVKYQKQALETGKAAKEDDWMIKDYASRIPLYEQKQAYRDDGKN